jgi:SAM-dependent methyltransferase
MTDAAPLTDRTALLRNRGRTKRDAMFLHDLAKDDIQDRISLVKKDFTKPLIVTGCPEIWADTVPNARVIDDPDVLDVTPDSHDLVIHAMCLHWANDPVGQLIQSKRALRPDGLFLGILFAGQTLSELRACLADAEINLRGGLSPRIAPMADLRDLGGLMQRAGFALPVADLLETPVQYSSLSKLLSDLRGMGEGNALAGRDRRFSPKRLFQEAEKTYSKMCHGGPLTATFELAILTGWAPSENQPKALRPGSATNRLADALGTLEKPLRD